MWEVQPVSLPREVIEMEVCPICRRSKGFVDGAWICFTPWWECGVNGMTSREIELFTILRDSVDHEIYEEFLSMWRKLKYDEG